MKINSYKELLVWQKSIELVKEIYKISNSLPQSELYGLVSQMRRASVSIPSNIAEGYKRQDLGSFVQFLSTAEGSSAELETQLIIISDLYAKIDISKANNLLIEVQKMLYSIVKKLNAKR